MKRYQLMALIFSILFLVWGYVMPGWGFAQEPSKTAGQKTKGILPHQEQVESGWGRDPFLLPSGVHLLSRSDPALTPQDTPSRLDGKSREVPPPSLEVRAILISDRLRLASIDQQIVTVGDLIHDERILEIQTDRVVLGKEGRKRILLLTQSPVRLTIEGKKEKGEKR